MARRSHWRTLLRFVLPTLLAVLGLARPGQAADPFISSTGDDPVLQRIAVEHSTGLLSTDEALLYGFARVFEPSALPPRFLDQPLPMLRCATPLMLSYQQHHDELTSKTRVRIDQYLSATPSLMLQKAASYLSAGGHFQLNYVTGAGGVSPTDVSPLNGIPDFVERVAQYLEESWQSEIVQLGFTPPALGGELYQISFEEMGSYGYTTTAGAGAPGTRIVLHTSFEGFPPNTDPEGNPIGAAKVTCAHEFKHASQYATSGWVEGGWLELDATWMEDIVYDQVNDYYQYLVGGSPISDPSLSLDFGGTGSYPDCVFQHWMSESWSEQIVLEFWQRRAAVSGESMTDSYNWALQQHGSSMIDGFADFATWNYLTGNRSVAGLGYGEAAAYPTSPLTASFSVLPASFSGAIPRMAADLLHFSGFSGNRGTVQVTVTRQSASPIRVNAIVEHLDGSINVEKLPLSSTRDVLSLSVPLEQVSTVALAVSNGDRVGGGRSYAIEVEEILRPPTPLMVSSPAIISTAVLAGEVTDAVLHIENLGEDDSVLDFNAFAMQSMPATIGVGQNIAGSGIYANLPAYTPGDSVDVTFTVTNLSSDFEWLQQIDLSVPVGVTVLGSSDFVGGSAGDLVSSGAVGDGITLSWFDANGSWGNVKGNGEQATAVVSMSFDLALFGDLAFDYVITGDGFGGAPHQVADQILVAGPPAPSLDLLFPDGGERVAVGSTLNVQWSPLGLGRVGLDLSRDGGTSWENLAWSIPDQGSYSWTASGPASADCLMRLSSSDSSMVDVSSSVFTIFDPVPWLSVSPSSASVQKSALQTLQLSIDAQSLAVGHYDAVLVIDSNAPTGTLIIPVSVDVIASATPNGHLPVKPRLAANYPNPFNPTTTIGYQLSQDGWVRLTVLDSRGRKVRELIDAFEEAGTHERRWDGTDDSGRRVASGSYLYRLQIGRFVQTRRMALIK